MRLNWRRRSELVMAPAARRHRRWRRAAMMTVIVCTGLALADHLGAFGYLGDDRTKFDRATATVTDVIDVATIRVNVGGEKIIVRLLGVEASANPAGKWHLE